MSGALAILVAESPLIAFAVAAAVVTGVLWLLVRLIGVLRSREPREGL